jgi:hypothetical protein
METQEAKKKARLEPNEPGSDRGFGCMVLDEPPTDAEVMDDKNDKVVEQELELSEQTRQAIDDAVLLGLLCKIRSQELRRTCNCLELLCQIGEADPLKVAEAAAADIYDKREALSAAAEQLGKRTIRVPIKGGLKGYVGTRKAGEALGFSADHVADLCKEGKIPGAIRYGKGYGRWLIPQSVVA